MILRKTVCFITALVLASVAYGGTVKIEGLPNIKMGDPVEDVQKALDTKLEPEKMESMSPIATKKSQLHLKTKGIWVFFDKDKVYEIRLDKPFPGNFGGVKLGDPSSKIEKTFGPPIKRDTWGIYSTYTYYFDDVTTTRFAVNRDDEIETIFLFK